MADTAERYPDNVAGEWFVDSNCIMCSLCIEMAPDNIEQAPDSTHARFYHQPDKPDQLTACQRAREQCPTEAIGQAERPAPPASSS